MPPVWLIAALGLSWVLSGSTPGFSFGAWAFWAGPMLVAAGLVLMGLAFVEFRRARTTIIPGNQPDALITSGVFRFSRNPIYLADTLILTGLILRWDAVLAVPLILLFVWIIRTRFINGEEARLVAAFPDAFAAYRARTRRWI